MGLSEGVSTNSLFLCLKEGAATGAITKVSPSCLQLPWCVPRPPHLAPSVYTHMPWGRATVGPCVCFCVQCVIVCPDTHPESLLSYSLLTGIWATKGWGFLGSFPLPHHCPHGIVRLRFLCTLQVCLLEFADPADNLKQVSFLPV